MPAFVRIIFILFLVTFLMNVAHSEESVLSGLKANDDKIYVFRLKNGDLITGSVIEFISDEIEGDGIKIKTELGKAILFSGQIADLSEKGEYYRHNHRIYLLPTAEPIGNNHFIGSFELLFFYAGAGIGDFLSITAGRSMIPGIASKEQASVINAKATVYREDFESFPSSMYIAFGGNLAWINHNNRLMHLYGAATFQLERTIITGSLFYKGGSGSAYTLFFGQNEVGMVYEDGAIGLGLGLDTKFSAWHDLHFIGELWNINIAKPTHTGVLLGFRLCDTQFSADFGLSFFTQPIVAPFFSFAWTPFKN